MEIDFRPLKKRCVTRVVGDIRKIAHEDSQIFESINMQDHKKECLLGVGIARERFYVDLQGGGF